MISFSLFRMRRLAAALAVCAAVTGLAAVPARAWVSVGVGIPFYGPGFYPGPYYYPRYYPPPVYYAPPPVYYAPPQTYTPAPQAGGSQMCYAGTYTCPMDRPVASGSGCYCLGNGGQRVWGRAN